MQEVVITPKSVIFNGNYRYIRANEESNTIVFDNDIHFVG